MIKIFSRFIAGIFSLSLLLTGCHKAPANPLVKIATKPMTEQFIIGEMLAALIEQHTSLNVQLVKGVGGGSSNIHPALLKGDFDLYGEYTGTAWSFILNEPPLADNSFLWEHLTEAYHNRFDLEWVGLYGFNNSYGLAVRRELANRYHINTYSDLSAHSSVLSFGAEYDFYERADGYEALTAAYNMHFKEHKEMDIGLKYTAINNRQIDVMNIFTTDGQLNKADLVVLEDDRHFFPVYYSGTVIRRQTLERYPELRNVLLMMNDILDEQTMAKLNYAVETEKKDEKTVAVTYLKSLNLL